MPKLFTRPFNRFHRSVLQRPKVASRDRKGVNAFRATAAPRGIAKTTLAIGDIVHDVVYGLEEYIIIVSAETRLARKITGNLLRIFKAKVGPLAELYGPFEVAGGVDEFRVTLPTEEGPRVVGVLARSFGTQIRGANEDGVRPTRIVIDDGERPDRVRNADIRRAQQDFLDEDIIRAGAIDGGLIVDFNGTVLHPDSVLANAIRNPTWEGTLWKACESWPERMDLWVQCGAIYTNLAAGKMQTRRRLAWEFYQQHRLEMDRGARMLDDVAMPLFRFMEAIWSQGMSSVLKELQNEPRAPGSTLFDSTQFKRARIDGKTLVTAEGRIVALSELRVCLRLDPIPGDELTGFADDDRGAGGSDYAAVVALGRDGLGYGFVLDCVLKRMRDSEQIAVMWAMAEKWKATRGTIESNGFQRLFGREFRRQQAWRKHEGQFWQIAVDDDTSTVPKNDRLASLEGPISAGWLQFCDHLPPLLFRQFDEVPGGDHDDGPDAVEGAWRNSTIGGVAMSPTPIGFHLGQRVR